MGLQVDMFWVAVLQQVVLGHIEQGLIDKYFHNEYNRKKIY